MINPCENCAALCCKYIVLDIDTPEELKDFENIKWYVVHKNTEVFVDDEGVWNIRFLTKCDQLDKNNKCKIYQTRPEICKEFSSKTCPQNKEYEEILTFKKIEDVEDYIKNVFEKGKHLVE